MKISFYFSSNISCYVSDYVVNYTSWEGVRETIDHPMAPRLIHVYHLVVVTHLICFLGLWAAKTPLMGQPGN